MKLLIGIPAYNEEQTIEKVIKSLPKKIAGIDEIETLLVDDGSTDATGDIAAKNGAKVLTHIINRGLGGALKTIFAYARDNRSDILVTFDADGQHRGTDIEKLLQPILHKTKDVMIGSRWKTKDKKPFSRYIVNQFANIATWLLFGVYTTDSQSGLRAFNRKAIEKINITGDGMEVSSEFFKEIKAHNLRFGEVAISPIYSAYSQHKGQRLDNAPEVFFRLLLRFIR